MSVKNKLSCQLDKFEGNFKVETFSTVLLLEVIYIQVNEDIEKKNQKKKS